VIKVKIYIHPKSGDWLEEVSLFIKLVAIPKRGECLFLDAEDYRKLEKMATSSLEMVAQYRDYLYGASCGVEYPTEKDIENLYFDDCFIVGDNIFHANQDYVSLELTSG